MIPKATRQIKIATFAMIAWVVTVSLVFAFRVHFTTLGVHTFLTSGFIVGFKFIYSVNNWVRNTPVEVDSSE